MDAPTDPPWMPPRTSSGWASCYVCALPPTRKTGWCCASRSKSSSGDDIETAYGHGVISGYSDGTFRPGNDVTRAQLCKIVVLAEGLADDCPTPGHFSDVPPADPFYCYIETAYNHGIITGYADGTFRPGNSATRGQICKIVYQAITAP